MKDLLQSIRIQVNQEVYLKDPESTEIGKKIIKYGIQLIDKLGFEDFTFRKLSQEIGSPESTIYRYFENKHNLLIYLTAWYWAYTEYKLVFSIANISSPEERLRKAIQVITTMHDFDEQFSHIDENALNNIVISESTKTYCTKSVEKENSMGYFGPYKNLVQRVAELVKTYNPGYPNPHTLISTVIESAHQQQFFAEHLPGLTDLKNDNEKVSEYFINLVFQVLKKR